MLWPIWETWLSSQNQFWRRAVINYGLIFDCANIEIHKIIATGSSRPSLKACSHLAPTAPSTTRWSQLRVTVKYWDSLNLEKNTCMVNVRQRINFNHLPLFAWFVWHQPRNACSYSKDAALRRVDNGTKMTNTKHAQVGHTNRASWKQFFQIKVTRH